MENWIELVKGRLYLIFVCVAALVAATVVAVVGRPVDTTATLILWAVCFVVVLAAELAVYVAFIRRSKQSFTYLGIDEVYIDRTVYVEMREELFQKADKICLHSIYAHLGGAGLDSLVEEALRNGKTVEILIADPSSGYVQGNDPLQLANMSDATPQKIEHDIEILREIESTRHKRQWRGHLELRTYLSQPMWSIYFFDNELFAAPYLYRIEGSKTFCIHCRNKGAGQITYDQFRWHYRRLWNKARLVNLRQNTT